MRVTAMRYNKKKYYRPHKENRGDLNLAVRQGKWKGIWNAETESLELYDLGRDPGESEDVSAAEPELVEEMISFAQSQLARCEASAAGKVQGERVAARRKDPTAIGSARLHRSGCLRLNRRARGKAARPVTASDDE